MQVRMMTILLAALMLLCSPACAQEGYIGAMEVVNCQEWVSLRELPDTTSACLIEVPLGALVENCRTETKAFHSGEYGGIRGYILAQYLEAIPEAQMDLGKMYVISGGEWAPMYADTTSSSAIVQWMVPGEQIEAARESVEGYIYGICRGARGYIPVRLAKVQENAQDDGEK